jgi:hypothetical protein
VKRSLSWLPDVGVVAFVLLYFYAASLYPGGTQSDPSTAGYSQLGNYWCDLLDASSYSGQANPGRPFALAATIFLPLALLPLWCAAPTLLGEARAARIVVPVAGCSSMLLAIFVFTSAHDLVVNASSVLGFVAFATLLDGLRRRREHWLVTMGVVSLLLCVANFTMWQTGSLLGWMPMVQKAAFATVLVWALCTSARIRRVSAERSP